MAATIIDSYPSTASQDPYNQDGLLTDSSPLYTSSSTGHGSHAPYDLICVGFGPAQLAIALALEEQPDISNARILFLERRSHFQWHSESQFPGSRMQDAFMNDLATSRDPRSQFTYANYLHSHDRLCHFTNAGELRPLVEEFHDYLAWCAGQVRAQCVRYGVEVVGVTPTCGSGLNRRTPASMWSIQVRDTASPSQTTCITAKSVILPRSKSMQPHIDFPVELLQSKNLVDTSEYSGLKTELTSVSDQPLDVAIVGTSVQTLEVAADLVSNPALGNITLFTQEWALKSREKTFNSTNEPLLEEIHPLCSLWTHPSPISTPHSNNSSPSLLRTLFSKSYAKQLSSHGRYSLTINTERSVQQQTAASATTYDLVITESTTRRNTSAAINLLGGIDRLIRRCKRIGVSTDEVEFKRGAVAARRCVWVVSASEQDGGSGRALAKDLAVRAADIAGAIAEHLIAEEEETGEGEEFLFPVM